MDEENVKIFHNELPFANQDENQDENQDSNTTSSNVKATEYKPNYDYLHPERRRPPINKENNLDNNFSDMSSPEDNTPNINLNNYGGNDTQGILFTLADIFGVDPSSLYIIICSCSFILSFIVLFSFSVSVYIKYIKYKIILDIIFVKSRYLLYTVYKKYKSSLKANKSIKANKPIKKDLKTSKSIKNSTKDSYNLKYKSFNSVIKNGVKYNESNIPSTNNDFILKRIMVLRIILW